MDKNTEKSAGLWIGLSIVLLSLIYIFTSLGKTDWIRYVSLVWGFFLSIFLMIESGIITYVKKKEFSKIDFGDFVVIITVMTSAIIFMNTLFFLNFIKIHAPISLVDFSTKFSVIFGILGAILGIVHAMYPRFR